MQPTTRHRLLGLGLLLGGAGLNWWNWIDAVKEGTFFVKLALLAPFCAGFGLMLLVAPPRPHSSLTEETHLGTWRRLSLLQKTFIVVSALASLANFALITGIIEL